MSLRVCWFNRRAVNCDATWDWFLRSEPNYLLFCVWWSYSVNSGHSRMGPAGGRSALEANQRPVMALKFLARFSLYRCAAESVLLAPKYASGYMPYPRLNARGWCGNLAQAGHQPTPWFADVAPERCQKWTVARHTPLRVVSLPLELGTAANTWIGAQFLCPRAIAENWFRDQAK